jgi:L,D-transpeptidase catalytic domain
MRTLLRLAGASVLVFAILALGSQTFCRAQGIASHPASASAAQSGAPTGLSNASVSTTVSPDPAVARYTAPSPAGPSGPSTRDGVLPGGPAIKKPTLTPGQEALSRTTDSSYLNPINWAVMIYKSRHELIVYYKGRFYKSYRAVFGRSLRAGPKLWAGDDRTPEGVYTIVEKHRSKRFRWFLRLNYPNFIDRIRYQRARSDGLLPGRHRPGEGGNIGIHGTDEPILNSGDINWTTGCVSVGNTAIDELDTLLPIGTLVLIKP